MQHVPILAASYVPNLTFYDPNLTAHRNVPKIEQCQLNEWEAIMQRMKEKVSYDKLVIMHQLRSFLKPTMYIGLQITREALANASIGLSKLCVFTHKCQLDIYVYGISCQF